jgi:hypothetical protein
MYYNPRRGEKFPKINGIECYGWLYDGDGGRHGWVIHMYDREAKAYRYFRATHVVGEGYSLVEITNAGRDTVPISGPYKRLAEVKQAGLEYLVSNYGW